VPAIVVSGSESVADAVEAMKIGAADYVVKPFEGRRIQVSSRNALLLARQRNEIARLRASEPPVFSRIRKDEVLLDLRTVLAGEEAEIEAAVRAAAGAEAGPGASRPA
jgi:DNA-binding NtrC family response regulator